MGKHFSLVASDNFKLGAYRADPSGPAKGGIVVVQEIFGVNHHIRAVCDRLAGEGYAALAPAVFDRQQPNFESGYSPDEIANARKFVANPDWGAMLRDVQAIEEGWLGAQVFGGGMAAEVAKVAPAIAAQQAEIDDDPAPGELGRRRRRLCRSRRLLFSFVVGRHVKPTVRHGLRAAPPRITDIDQFSRDGRLRKVRKGSHFACRLWFV